MIRLLSIALALLASACEPCMAQTLQLDRWKRAQVPAHRVRMVDAVVFRILANRRRYEAVAARSGVPWHVIASLHNMEASGSFAKHLHEGSPLTGRTRWVPKGRPTWGKPPYRWEDSAVDALAYDKMAAVNWRSLDAALYACERYNGTGYLKYHRNVPTPYLWSHTSIYNPPRGKYVADGKWSSTAVSSQTGVAAIWKRLESKKALTLPK